MRQAFQWQLRTKRLNLGPRTLLMGILNVTPDSFSDGGRFYEPVLAVEHALQMLEDGADIVDIGGESTRPGTRVALENDPQSAGVAAEEELERVLPVIEALRRASPDAVISVDTYKASVARAAAAAGVEIINDVSALRWDAAMPAVAAESGCGVVLMHTRGRPEEWRSLPPPGDSIVETVARELSERVAAAECARIARDKIVVDPGFGFGKGAEGDYGLLANLAEFKRLGYPLLIGTSRKSFVGRTVSRTREPVPPEQRLYGTLATVAAGILNGAHLVRVHDVAASREAAAICDHILQARRE